MATTLAITLCLLAAATALPLKVPKVLSANDGTPTPLVLEASPAPSAFDKLGAMHGMFGGDSTLDTEDAAETVLTPAAAAAAGMLINSDDNDKLAGNTVKGEETATGAFQGDMVPASSAQLALWQVLSEGKKPDEATVLAAGMPPQQTVYGGGAPWANSNMPYCYAAHVSAHVKKSMDIAIAQYKKAIPCLTFTDVGLKTDGDGHSAAEGGTAECNAANAVYVTSSKSGCWSYVGKLAHSSTQGFNIGTGCESVGTVMHELGHALGQLHEQSRADRDYYVSINYGSIKSGTEHNFDKETKTDTSRPYDVLSLMHYSAKAFSTDDQPTITVKPAGYAKYTDDPSKYSNYEPGNRVGLTQLDAEQFADLYRISGGDASCVAATLTAAGPCTDLKASDGSAWTDSNGRGCSDYKHYVDAGYISSCSVYASGPKCCDCGGGLRLQIWVASPIPAPTTAPTAAGDSTTWSAFGTGAFNCAWFATNDPGCTKFTDWGQKSNCPAACASVPTPAPTPAPTSAVAANSDSSTWSAFGGGTYTCAWFGTNDPGCTTYKDYGQKTACPSACGSSTTKVELLHTLPVGEKKELLPLLPTAAAAAAPAAAAK